jgi:hypothetical protein
MFAKNLEAVLYELCRDGDVHAISRSELDRRFGSLRGYGRLPRGRENRERPLTDSQIASAIMGMAPVETGWAGHAAVILEKLKPVGGEANAFLAAPNLLTAITAILGDGEVRKSLVNLRMSVAECGTNSHGSATVLYEADGAPRQTFYVPNEAVSLLQPGADARFDSEQRHAPFSREVILNRRFFDRLARAVQRDRKHPRPPAGDGSEYDAEDAEKVRRVRLGVRPSSRFLHVGVDNQVTWPRQESLIAFDRYKLVLMPKTRDHVQSVHIDLHENRLSTEEALTVVNRFLSLLTWCDDQYAIAEHAWSGSPIPIPVSKRDLAFTTTHQWGFARDIPASVEVRRALALYREARNAEQNFMISYAVLNYYKVIEIRYPDGPAARGWIARNFPAVGSDPHDQYGIKEFLAACGSEPPERYIYKACRVAVAHASDKYPSDPDEAGELRRLDTAADVMRRLARHFISLELGVSDCPFGDQWAA